MLAPFLHTQQLIKHWSNNEEAPSEIIKEAIKEAWQVEKKDENSSELRSHTSAYISNVGHHFIHEKEEKHARIVDNVAWHLASHNQRIEANGKYEEDILHFLKNNKLALERLPCADEISKSLEIINTLLAKVNALKNQPNCLSPMLELPPEIWHFILFEYVCCEQGVTQLNQISKVFDSFVQCLVSEEINTKKLNLPDLKFYSIAQITKFFGKNISNLKHISFLFEYGSKTHLSRVNYLKFRHEKKRVFNAKNKTTIKNEQNLFSEFIKSLKNIDSFCFDRLLVSEEKFNKNLALPITQQISLTPALFLNFCKNNPQLKRLEISHWDNYTQKSENDLIAALTHLKCLEVFHYPKCDRDLTYRIYENPSKNLLNCASLHALEELTFTLNLADIDSLKNYKKLNKVALCFSKEVTAAQNMRLSPYTANIIKNLNASSVKELSITEGCYLDISPMPSNLKTLNLINHDIDLPALLASLSSSSMFELHLQRCTINGLEEALAILKECKSFKKLLCERSYFKIQKILGSQSLKSKLLATQSKTTLIKMHNEQINHEVNGENSFYFELLEITNNLT